VTRKFRLGEYESRSESQAQLTVTVTPVAGLRVGSPSQASRRLPGPVHGHGDSLSHGASALSGVDSTHMINSTPGRARAIIIIVYQRYIIIKKLRYGTNP
jgi:hypothetical protein